ncbi:fructosamine kinase family protein [Carboxylicivirga sp. A043]|uniref:fructosamine kinase family protein n=1 Tax=Carboxylicivirga litoralis TaxID=2816963 RepID=UPI0021CB96D1|nr:fructosamine kinase family protein [Carboxylicivirga sp. A043]MCU4156194.1 fructosamine kinase family protein [Carboxylicivirga sp. A043]
MSNKIFSKIEKALQCSITKQNIAGGGCIAQSSVITTNDKRSFFLKQGFSGSMFRNEARGLQELAKTKAIRIPEVILVDDDLLLLEAIRSGRKKAGFFTEFGQAFARMHLFTHSSYGFDEDNFIGSTPQVNKWMDNWADFYFTNRLLFQFKLAEKNGHSDNSFRKAFAVIEQNIETILKGSEEPPCLLHGDLWGGNYMVDDRGEAVLIDPAVYYGHREADLAMTKLFGGFSDDFYTSYNAAYPLKDGYAYRENIYLLYHVLNHLNLFGASYKQQAIQLMNSYQ